MPVPYGEEEYWIIDNGGYVDGPHLTYGAATEAAEECRDDPEFVSKGNMAIVKMQYQLDNFMNNIDSE